MYYTACGILKNSPWPIARQAAVGARGDSYHVDAVFGNRRGAQVVKVGSEKSVAGAAVEKFDLGTVASRENKKTHAELGGGFRIREKGSRWSPA